MAIIDREEGGNTQSGQGDSDQPRPENLPSGEDIIEDDDDLHTNDNSTLKVHNKLFTNLLASYVWDARNILVDKPQKKDIMFKISLVMLIGFSVFIIIVTLISLILVAINVDIIGLLAVILPSIVSFVTVIIEIPKLISKYLFNEKEEEAIVEIIKAIQEYDVKVRGGNLPKPEPEQ